MLNCQFSGCKIIFFDAGTYIVSSTLTIPAGTQVVGEAWSVIAGSGSIFQDQNNPRAVVRVGTPGSQGITEISDIIFSTLGPSQSLYRRDIPPRRLENHSPQRLVPLLSSGM